MVVHHGMPALIVSNYDLQFTSHFLHSLSSALGCKHSLSMAFHPEIDGLRKGCIGPQNRSYISMCLLSRETGTCY